MRHIGARFPGALLRLPRWRSADRSPISGASRGSWRAGLPTLRLKYPSGHRLSGGRRTLELPGLPAVGSRRILGMSTPEQPVIRLLVAGNQPIVVAGIRAILGDTAFLMLRELQDGEGIEQAISECRPDMIVLDEQLADKRTGIDAFLSLRADGDGTPVILLIGDNCEDGLLQAIEVGVDGVVPKSSAPVRLVQCLDTVRDGNRSIDQDLLQRAAGRSLERQEKAAVLSSLSPREQEIVRLLAADLRASEIARRLNISSVTVKVHLHNIYGKLGLTNRAALLRLIRQSQGAKPVTDDESLTTIIAVPAPRDLT